MLEGNAINLRLLREADLDEFVARSNAVTDAGPFGDIRLTPRTSLQKDFDQNGLWGDDKGILLITTRQDRMLGFICSFEGFRHENGFEVGYAIFRQEDRGRGYGTEAFRLFSAYLFELKPILRLHLKIHPENAASLRIAQKCGYEHEGTFRRFAFFRGAVRDTLVYARLRDAPTAANPAAAP